MRLSRLLSASVIALGAAAICAAPASADSVMTEFMETMVPHVDERVPIPAPAARVMAVTFTAAYDAWAAYDEEAVGVVTGNLLDGTGAGNREEAILHAMLTTLYGLTGKQNPYRQRLRWMGYNPDSESLDAQLGRNIGAMVLAERRQDGANQQDYYEDTSHYMVAPPEELAAWQPDFIDRMVQEPITPHWGRVVPFAMRNIEHHRPPAPYELGTAEFDAQVAEVLDYSANLTEEQKAIAEYWAPERWATPASHFVDITKDISEREGFSLDQDVRLFFTIGNAMMDAGVAAWDAKYRFNYVRPVTVIQRMGSTPIYAYDHRTNRPGTLAAEDWEPYLETPAFPEYVSGHSAFAAAWARAMELSLGTDQMDYTGLVYFLNEENSVHLRDPIQLHYQTFDDAAQASGMSRLYGGIHWMTGNTEGLAMGRALGEMAYRRAQEFFNGTATAPTPVFASVDTDYWQPMGEDGRMSTVLDPVPAGHYSISASLSSETGFENRSPVRLTVRSGDGSNRLLGVYDESRRPGPMAPWVSVGWRSTGIEPFYVTLESMDANADLDVVQIYQVRVN